MTVNKERIKLWVEALRSGEYQQARNCLKDGDRFCCLGVACDISGLGKWEDNGVFCAIDGDRRASVMPPIVCRWYGWYELDSNPAVTTAEGDMKYLAQLNDKNVSFADIADLIEQEFLKDDA